MDKQINPLNFRKTAYENVPVGVGFAGLDATITEVNEVYVEMFGYAKEEVCWQKTYFDLLDPSCHKEVASKVAEVAQGKHKSLDINLIGLRKDGSTFPFLATVFNLYDGQDNLVGVGGFLRDVTEEETIKAEQKQLREILKAAYDNFSDAIFIVSLADRAITFCNKATETIFGYCADELLGQTTQIIHVDEEKFLEFGRLHQQALAGKSTVSLEYVLKRKNGEIFPTANNLTPIFDKDGNTTAVFSTVRDLSTQKKLEEENKRTSDLIKYILERSQIVTFSLDPHNGYFVKYISDNVKEMTGFSTENFKDPTFWTQKVHPEDLQGTNKRVFQLNAGEKVQRYYRWKCADGSYKWFSDLIEKRVDESGSLCEVIGIWQCIHELKTTQIEYEQKSNEYIELSNEFNVLLNSITDELTFATTDLKVKWANKAALESLDKTKSDIELLDGYLCTKINDGPECLEKLVIKNKKAMNNIVYTEDNKIIGVKVYPIFNEKDEVDGILRSVCDITDRMKEQQNQELSSRLQSLGVLSAGIAHEINNPNSIILNNISILNEILPAILDILTEHLEKEGDFSLGKMPFTKLKRQIPDMAEDIEQSANRIKRIVDDLRGYLGSIQEEKPKRNDLGSISKTAIRLAGVSISQATNNFELHIEDKLPKLNIDRHRIEQVLVNLLINACQALTDVSQKISLRCFYDKEINRVCLEVEDHGQGIASQNLLHVMDPFYTTKKEIGGIGLGLSICRKSVESYGGTIEIKSQLGKGTKILCSFPCAGKAKRHE